MLIKGNHWLQKKMYFLEVTVVKFVHSCLI